MVFSVSLALLIGNTRNSPGKSCMHIKEINANMHEGKYWVQNISTDPILVNIINTIK